MNGNPRAIRGADSAPAVSWSLMLLLFLAAGSLVTVTGCSGCRRDDQAAQEDQDKKDKDKQKTKKDFEYERMKTIPGDPVLRRNLVKPGHFIVCTQEIKANNYPLNAELLTACTDRQMRPAAVPGTNYSLELLRPAPLPKGQTKNFETLFFVPDYTAFGAVDNSDTAVSQPSIAMVSRLRSRAGGREVTSTSESANLMRGHHFFWVVLAPQADEYAFLKTMHTVRPPGDLLDKVVYYEVVLPMIDREVPIPTQPLAWTSTAVVLWDGLNPQLLSGEQRTAMLDWLHWGGQLIVSGPDSLDSLQGTFLAPYLPVQKVASAEMKQAEFAELNDNWAMEVKRETRREVLRLEFSDEQPILGVEMKLNDETQSNFVNGTGKLVAERRVGNGRVVVTAFSLDDKRIVNWRSFDGFINGCLLRRPRRFFSEDAGTLDAKAVFADYGGRERDARLVSNLRYFSRDMRPYLETSSSSAAASDARRGNQPPDWRSAGYSNSSVAGVAAWNDNSGGSEAARRALEYASSIAIPKPDFVLKMLLGYLVVLVPVNWILFRLIGRVEWAWVAAPLIAIGGTFAVVRFANLDIGFVRSRNEVGVLELQGDYQRGHLTRYTALYTSLSTIYNVNYDDMSAVAMPFPDASNRQERLSTVRLERGDNVRLTGFKVQSNTTGFLHSEQMFDAGGIIRLAGSEDKGWDLQNHSTINLQAVGVIRRNDDGLIELAWVGDLASKQSRRLPFVGSADGRAWFPQWNSSSDTYSHNNEINQLLREFDENNDKMLSRTEIAVEHPLSEQFAEWDEFLAGNQRKNEADGFLDRFELLRWCRESRAGSISLGRLFDLTTNLEIKQGEYRMIGWTDMNLPGVRFRPQASQVETRMMVVAHLKRPQLPAAQPDQNSVYDIDVYTEDFANTEFGVTVDFVPPQLVRTRINGSLGAYVKAVEPDRPAAIAGIEPGDTITMFDGHYVESPDDLIRLIRIAVPGTVIEVNLLRGNSEEVLEVTLDEDPGPRPGRRPGRRR